MTERIGIYGVSAEMLALLPSLIAHPDLEIVRIYTGRARALLARLPDLDPELAAALVDLLSDRPESVSSDRSLSAIIEATHGLDPKVHSRDAGKRAAIVAFDVGQGTQDIGFRNDVTVTFDCRAAVPVQVVTGASPDQRLPGDPPDVPGVCVIREVEEA